MPSAESKKLEKIVELIQDGCSRYDKLVVEARKNVDRTKTIAHAITEYADETQDDDLEPEDIEDLVEDFKDTVEKLNERNREVETVEELFRTAIAKLRTAQTEATIGVAQGVENALDSKKAAALCISGSGVAASAGLATIVSGGLALPCVFLGASIVGMGAGLSCDIDMKKHLTWASMFAKFGRKLEVVYSMVTHQTHIMSRALSDVSTNSDCVLSKVRRIAGRSPSRRSTAFFKRRCIQLKEESEKLEESCIEYITKSDDICGITGSIAQLNIEN